MATKIGTGAVVKNISSNVGSRLKLFYGNKQYLSINNCNTSFKNSFYA